MGYSEKDGATHKDLHKLIQDNEELLLRLNIIVNELDLFLKSLTL